MSCLLFLLPYVHSYCLFELFLCDFVHCKNRMSKRIWRPDSRMEPLAGAAESEDSEEENVEV